MRRKIAAVAVLTFCGASCAFADSAEKKVDELFAAWSAPDHPGCAVGVLRGGKMLYSRGYGLADIEHDAAITPATVFHVASVSKQFTAMAIYLLAADGKLALDDDVRKYLPELHDFGRTITIRHLLHHTSGLRDQWDLLLLAGWRLGDVITEQDILDLVWRQQALNFAPGEKHLYSNTGYTLLGVIVHRVSGKTLREFTDERMFEPLRMTHTHFHEQYGSLVKGRAYSYIPLPDAGRGKYRSIALSYSNVGATSLFTTVEDLARWDENFYTGQVGGKALLASMQAKGVLNDGTEIDYASGLAIGDYRGLKVVEHSGADAGFRVQVLRFPDQHFSTIVLCNAGEANPWLLSRNVADIYLAAELQPLPTPAAEAKPTEVKIDPKMLDAYVGDYELMPNFILTVMRRGDQLVTQATGQPAFVVVPASERSFFPKEFAALLTFDSPGTDGKSAVVTLRQGGQDMRGPRLQRAHPSEARLQAYAGTYFSSELNTVYFVTAREGKLFARHPRGELELQPLKEDEFVAPEVGVVKFKCATAVRCDSFAVSTERVFDLRADKVDLGARKGQL
ncbi:MAG TPA: serine hydrolase [Steroidobacteraceae bacterium]|jgi:CubicO group peptidase (beta-lactamase class C family)